MVGIVTLGIGLVLGYLGQRSRFCTISGIRDFYLVHDTYRLKGLIGVIVGGLVGFSVVSLLGGNLPGFPLFSEGINIQPWTLIPLSLIGGFGMAYFSVMAEGCPFRQHVLAGEGRMSGIFYLVGLVVGVIFFDIVIVPFLQLITLLG